MSDRLMRYCDKCGARHNASRCPACAKNRTARHTQTQRERRALDDTWKL